MLQCWAVRHWIHVCHVHCTHFLCVFRHIFCYKFLFFFVFSRFEVALIWNHNHFAHRLYMQIVSTSSLVASFLNCIIFVLLNWMIHAWKWSIENRELNNTDTVKMSEHKITRLLLLCDGPYDGERWQWYHWNWMLTWCAKKYHQNRMMSKCIYYNVTGLW